jgi:hypothetical protein
LILQPLPQSWSKPDSQIPSPNLGFWYRVRTLPDVIFQFQSQSPSYPTNFNSNSCFLHLLIRDQVVCSMSDSHWQYEVKVDTYSTGT